MKLNMSRKFKITYLVIIVAVSIYSVAALKMRANFIATDKSTVGRIIDSFAENTKEGGHDITGLYTALGAELKSDNSINTSVDTINSNNNNYVKITVKVQKISALPFMEYSYEVDRTQPISKNTSTKTNK